MLAVNQCRYLMSLMHHKHTAIKGVMLAKERVLTAVHIV